MPDVRPLILAVLVLLACAPQASADMTTVRLSLHVAYDFWGERSCEPTVIVAEPPQGAFAAYADAGVCTIWIAPTTVALPRLLLCSVIVHEVGHLLGRAHVGDPNSIMAAPHTRRLPSGCARLWMTARALRQHGPRFGFASR